MSNPPNTFKDWQDYPATLDPVHIAWLKNAKKSKTAFAVADIEGVEISHKRFLTGVLLFSKKIAAYSPEQNVGLYFLVVVVEQSPLWLYLPLARQLLTSTLLLVKKH